jgi:hypothetical protein
VTTTIGTGRIYTTRLDHDTKVIHAISAHVSSACRSWWQEMSKNLGNTYGRMPASDIVGWGTQVREYWLYARRKLA